MVVRDLKVKDFKGQERDYRLYFNMMESEIMDFEFGTVKGGISEFYDRMLRAKDNPAIINALKDVVFKAYGILTADGESFQKSDEISRQFTYTQAYSDFMMKLYTDDAYGQAFLKELFPEELMKKILARVEEQNKKKEESANTSNNSQPTPITPGFRTV